MTTERQLFGGPLDGLTIDVASHNLDRYYNKVVDADEQDDGSFRVRAIARYRPTPAGLVFIGIERR